MNADTAVCPDQEFTWRARFGLNPVTVHHQIDAQTDALKGFPVMSRLKNLLVAAPIAAGLLAAPAAHADWRGGPHGGPGPHGYYGGRPGWHGHDHGPGVAGALLGLGAAAVIGGVIASQAYQPPPPVVYAPPPAYYPPPPAYYPPAYYPPPPGY